jgi:hypothetical protein
LDCGGKRSATPLLEVSGRAESGVVAALQSSLRFAAAGCHRSPNSRHPYANFRDYRLDFNIEANLSGALGDGAPPLFIRQRAGREH